MRREVLQHLVEPICRLIAAKDRAVLQPLAPCDDRAHAIVSAQTFDDDTRGIAGHREHAAVQRIDVIRVRVLKQPDVLAVVCPIEKWMHHIRGDNPGGPPAPPPPPAPPRPPPCCPSITLPVIAWFTFRSRSMKSTCAMFSAFTLMFDTMRDCRLSSDCRCASVTGI